MFRCNLAFNDTSPSDTMITALHEAMAWPTWDTIWLAAYPKLRNISWAPGATVNNTVNDNVAIGRGILGYGQQPEQFPFEPAAYNHSAVLPSVGNWNASAVADAQFVAADPVLARDFRLEPTSPVFKATNGAFQQIPAGQGPRPQGLKTDDASLANDAATTSNYTSICETSQAGLPVPVRTLCFRTS
jgi:hypothetical protein